MTTQSELRGNAERLAEAWYSSYRDESVEGGDPTALLTGFREQSDIAGPDSAEHHALALLLERLQEEGIDDRDDDEY